METGLSYFHNMTVAVMKAPFKKEVYVFKLSKI